MKCPIVTYKESRSRKRVLMGDGGGSNEYPCKRFSTPLLRLIPQESRSPTCGSRVQVLPWGRDNGPLRRFHVFCQDLVGELLCAELRDGDLEHLVFEGEGFCQFNLLAR